MKKISLGIPLFCVFLLGCDARIKTSIRTDMYMDRSQATKLITKAWLLIPFVPIPGLVREISDYGDFKEKIDQVRPSQKVTLFGQKVKKLSKIQLEKHKEYVVSVPHIVKSTYNPRFNSDGIYACFMTLK